MIGYSKHAKTRYHRFYSAYSSAVRIQSYRAKCHLIRRLNHVLFRDNEEAELKKAAPHLSRCPKCWKGEK